MRIPCSTYRLQFHHEFTFRKAQAIVSYLSHLGISDIYASPIFHARSGSKHGYDVVDPTRLNPELGSEDDFLALSREVKAHSMGWLQDIIPNHMAFDWQNRMLMDVFENGKASEYYNFFDANWDHAYETMRGRLLAPFLGKPYGETLEDGEISLEYAEKSFTVQYYGWKFPLKIESYAKILMPHLETLEQQLGKDHPDFIKFSGMLYVVKAFPGQEASGERYDQGHFAKQMLWELYQDNESIREFIDKNLEEFNGRGDSAGFNLLDDLLFDQFFRLSFWKVASEEVNYRRFFNINELISVRIEDPVVFRTCHALILKLMEEGTFSGLRIDHIDGLYDPLQYLQRLQEATGGAYVVVEKILGLDEDLPALWPAQGTSGYDYLNILNGLFCAQANEEMLEKVYTRFVGLKMDYADLVYEKKQVIIERYMTGDVDNLAHILRRISSRDRLGCDITLYGLRRAIHEVLSVFPVYRTYINSESLTDTDRRTISEAVNKAKRRRPDLVNELKYLKKILLLQFEDYIGDRDQREWIHFVLKFQQFTGPLMAKGFEDTTLYVYNRLISLNEVGGEPHSFGVSVDRFHDFNLKRAKHWPHSLNASSTHDTKRSEDVRARINVLSEIPKEWETRVRTWQRMNRAKKEKVRRRAAPDRNDEYFFYQTVVGAFPFDTGELADFTDRVKDYTIKAIREAKVHTGWLRPDTDYEDAYMRFIDNTLAPSKNNEFLQDFIPFHRKIAHFGILNSLSQALLKFSSPGVPDLYQGTELWTLSLVDPDNRRPVDFQKRSSFLEEIIRNEGEDGYVDRLLKDPQDGRIKQFLTYRALKARNENPNLFLDGAYVPLQVEGRFKEHVVAFGRRTEGLWAVALAPRFLTALLGEGEYPIGAGIWEDTQVIIPDDAPSQWVDTITSSRVSGSHGIISIGAALSRFPVALLLND